MMAQSWLEMVEIRRRKFASSTWITLRTVQPICKEGKLAGVDGVSAALHQGQTLIANCASVATTIAELLERLPKSEKDKRG